MTITASMVKELRDRSGAGMMDAKKALTETSGDMEAAMDWLRTKGIAKAEKKSGRVAAEGIVFATASGNKGAMVEVNSETDFVSKNEQFQAFVKNLADVVLSTGKTDIEALKTETYPGSSETVGETFTNLIATIGENMNMRRAEVLEVASGAVAGYVHMGGKIGVLVAIEAGSSSDKLSETARQVAMHVAASNPLSLNAEAMDQGAIDREKAVYVEQARESGKPDNIIEKMVEGRMRKFFEENCLVDQAFIMDTDRKVGQIVEGAENGAKITAYTRFGLGEGIEIEEEDFAAEVAKVANG